MFENMTNREKTLAMIVLSLVPITLAFLGVFWFVKKYNENNLQVISLSEQIDAELEKTKQATKANRRRIYYRSISLPAKITDAANDYQVWLKDLARDQIKMDFKSISPREGSELRYRQKNIGRSKSFQLLVDANLPQLIEFLHAFYSVDLLHRINSIKIIPLSEGVGTQKKVRSGRLSLQINIEALSMVDADLQREFTESYRKLNRSLEDYQTQIVRRNVFGPANNTPTVAARPSSSYTSGTDVKVSLSGDDADEQDVLNFELLESEIEGAKLVQADGDSKRATIEIPGQKAGSYEFRVGVRDSGFPPKDNETKFTVTFRDPKIVEKKPDPPPPPKYQHAKQTRITTIVNDSDDQWIVWIKVRTLGQKYYLKTGESFELDDKQWTIESIGSEEAVVRVDNKRLTFGIGDPFDTPRKEEVIAETTQVDSPPKAGGAETAQETSSETITEPETGDPDKAESLAKDTQ